MLFFSLFYSFFIVRNFFEKYQDLLHVLRCVLTTSVHTVIIFLYQFKEELKNVKLFFDDFSVLFLAYIILHRSVR